MSVSVRVSVCLSVRDQSYLRGTTRPIYAEFFFAHVTYGREGWMRAWLQMPANRVTDKHL